MIFLLLDVDDRVFELFTTTETLSDTKRNRKALAKIPHPEWIPAALRQYDKEVGVRRLGWKTPDDGSGRPACRGRYDFPPLEDIYGDWEGAAYFDMPDEPGLEPENPRLRDFKIVDIFVGEAGVGLYHDAAQDPGLYYLEFGNGDEPYPLHVDFAGYLQLLRHTMGYLYWPKVVLSLLPNDGRNPAYRTSVDRPEKFRRDMTAWVPEFDYDAFVACYHAVKLQNYTPSSESEGTTTT
ncbi:hypothetical protein Q5H93_03495 [Hymenobacter sp. ASUV-10]|uniref:SMI1/KNR4 family protein n=1 Tax=Hymenobacter aranciens TaxID=3063996 RepID=A0ABT9B6G2_9BACT|nr:hypothetical protein [Hymenobacter sp. ASUV-10]MDO7873783.1 hypothetical protein [Hymenobacter sp. ASUV-10]